MPSAEATFCPSTVFIFAGNGESLVKGDSVFTVRRGCDPVDDRAGSVGVLVRPEEHVSRVAMAAADEKTYIERVPAEKPVELVPRIIA